MLTKNETNPAKEPLNLGIKTRLIVALATALALVIGFGGWSVSARLHGAVIAVGQVVVDGHSKKIQHASGGIVRKILVKNGDRVETGNTIAELEEIQTKAALGIITTQLTELQARRARHAATRDNAEKIIFPESFLSLPGATSIAVGEQHLFDVNRTTRDGQRAQLKERIGQLEQEILGLAGQQEAKSREVSIVKKEVARLRKMYRKRLTSITRVLAMEREETRISGELSGLKASIARTQGRITEIKLQILALDQEARSEAQSQLRDIEAQIARLNAQKLAAEDDLKRVVIRAPHAGIVHNLTIHTIGGVVAPGEPLALIVPNDDRLAVDVQIAPQDIDQIKVGQRAMLRFTAFNQRTTPELPGTVQRIGADLSTSPKSDSTFYIIRIATEDSDLGKLTGPLLPGMPVEAYIQTTARTPLSYLLKPLTDQFGRAFREQ